jgi:hypothetical protein
MIHNKVHNHSKRSLKVNNFFIDFYLNDLNRRLNNNKPFLRDYVIVIILLISILKVLVTLFVELDHETHFILFNVSKFIGGVEKYNTIAFLMACIMGLNLHRMLYLTTSKKLMIWTQLFEMTRGNISPLQLGLDINDSIIVRKFISRARFVYKIASLSIISYGANYKV